MLNRILPSGKISTIWATIWTGQERLEEALLIILTNKLLANKVKLAKVKLNCHSDISAYLKLSCHINTSAYSNIAKFLKISRYIFKSVKQSIRGRSEKAFKKRYKEVLGGSYFLVTRLGLVL